jgi:hypothetical protein
LSNTEWAVIEPHFLQRGRGLARVAQQKIAAAERTLLFARWSSMPDGAAAFESARHLKAVVDAAATQLRALLYHRA